MRISQTVKAHLAAIVCVTLWGSAFVGIRIGVAEYSAGSLALLRYLIASVCMLIVYVTLPHRQKFSWKQLLQIMALGMIGIGIYNIALNTGEVTIDAAVAGMIIAQMPVFATLLAMLILREYLSPIGMCGIIISILGVSVITFSQNNGFHWNWGVMEVIVAALSGATYSVLQKPVLKNINPIQFTVYSLWGGTLLLLIYLPDLIQELPQASWHVTSWIIYLGIFPAAISYVLWSYAIAYIPVTKVANYLYLMPLVAILLSGLLLQEFPTMGAIVGGLIAIVGTIIVSVSKMKSANAASPVSTARLQREAA